MLLPIFALALSAEPDTLAGVTLGTTLARDGYSCTANECAKPSTVAGQLGKVTVSLCGDLVRRVSFEMTFVPVEWLVTFGPEYVRSKGLSAWTDSAVETAKVAIDGGLAAAGWTVISQEPYERRLNKVLVDKQGRLRSLALVRDKVPMAEKTSGRVPDFETFTILVQAGDSAPCTDGL